MNQYGNLLIPINLEPEESSKEEHSSTKERTKARPSQQIYAFDRNLAFGGYDGKTMNRKHCQKLVDRFHEGRFWIAYSLEYGIHHLRGCTSARCKVYDRDACRITSKHDDIVRIFSSDQAWKRAIEHYIQTYDASGSHNFIALVKIASEAKSDDYKFLKSIVIKGMLKNRYWCIENSSSATSSKYMSENRFKNR